MLVRNLNLSTMSLGIAIFLTGSSWVMSPAQTCSELLVYQANGVELNKEDVARYISSAIHRSVLVEVAWSDNIARPVSLPVGSITLAKIARLLDHADEVNCAVKDGVVYFAAKSIVGSPLNALNHIFKSFQVPQDADMFLLNFKSRLVREAFDPAKADEMTGPGGGAVPGRTKPLPLNPEHLRNIDARDLFVREAGQATMSLTIEVPVRLNSKFLQDWSNSGNALTLRADP